MSVPLLVKLEIVIYRWRLARPGHMYVDVKLNPVGPPDGLSLSQTTLGFKFKKKINNNIGQVMTSQRLSA